MLSHRFIVKLCSALLLVGIFLTLPQFCHSHGHSHDHHGHSHDHHGHAHDHHGHAHDHHGHSHGHVEERPSFKYSKEANVPKPPPPPPPAKKVEPQEHHHHGHSHEHAEATEPKRTTVALWTEAIGSTLLISVAPFIVLFFIPIDSSPERQPLLKVLLSFASGGLLGDAFLHLIPHALMAHAEDEDQHHSHSHGHSHGDGHSHGHDMTVGIWVLSGIIAFLAVEKFVRIVKGSHGHGHSHSHAEPKKDSKEAKPASEGKKEKKEKATKEVAKPSGMNSHGLPSKLFHNNFCIFLAGDIKVAGYLNLAADFTHNFTDGLAIGASFLAGRTTGIVTTVTVLLHEVPHEIGDFAILIQSGCDRKKVFSNILTNITNAM